MATPPIATQVPQLVFVGGSPRSGTTLLQNILDSHPEILGGPEFLHLEHIVQVRNAMHESASKGWLDEFCGAEEVDGQFARLIEDFLFPLAHKHEKRILSEKTPSNILVFRELMDLFPNAHFIHVVRDPRAIAASMLQVGMRAEKKGQRLQGFTRDIGASARYIQRCLLAGDAAAKHAPDRLLTVRYESLVAEPAAETKRICKFLRVEWNDAMLRPGEKQHLGEQAVTDQSENLWYNKSLYQRNPDPSEKDKWRQSLDPYQKLFLTRFFAGSPLLVQLGYSLSVDDLPFKERAIGIASSPLRKLEGRLKRIRERGVKAVTKTSPGQLASS